MGELRVSLPNFLTVGLMAFIFIFLMNRALTRFGAGNWRV